MKIYTKKGDKGLTSLIGGTRVPKYHIRIEAYGTVDELNSWLGLVGDQDSMQSQTELVRNIQNCLFVLGSQLASDPEKSKMKLRQISEQDIQELENSIDEMEKTLAPLTNFVLPGGNQANSMAHIGRCVCRRAERAVVLLNEESPVEPVIIAYLNRLSDWFFVLSRWASAQNGAIEVLWKG